MSANVFATHSQTTPNPQHVTHPDVGGVVYTCHMAAMHWAFMDLGDNGNTANARVSAIATAICPSCTRNAGNHSSIPHEWYGQHFCTGSIPIANKAALYNAVNIGDVIILGQDTRRPVHTMIVVKKSSLLTRKWVYIRGFNNIGTLGTGAHLEYDNNDQDIHRARYWHGDSSTDQTFGNGLGRMFVIPYPTYSQYANAVRQRCTPNANDVMTYNG
ncbi:MAG: hypothetical protein ACWA5U_06385 [bacterium]